MISRAVLTRIDRPASQGRTRPLLAACKCGEDDEVEVFLKLSAGCDQHVINLARETIAVCLAGDLGLPVPRPWLVEVPPVIFPTLTDTKVSKMLRDSSRVAFGSTRSSGFAVWSSGHCLTETMYPLAAGILLFDAVIQNADRRTGNPNCLVRSNELLIFDHELTFMHRQTLNWQPPWVQGGMKSFETPGNHIFVRLLKGKQIDFGPVRQLWIGLSDTRLNEYEATIPKEWDVANCDVAEALKLIADARDNIDACIVELERILS